MPHSANSTKCVPCPPSHDEGTEARTTNRQACLDDIRHSRHENSEAANKIFVDKFFFWGGKYFMNGTQSGMVLIFFSVWPDFLKLSEKNMAV